MFNKYKKVIIGIVIAILFTFCISGFILKSNKVNYETVKIGFYDYYPYYYLDEESNYTGYYHDLMELISSRLNIKFEYIDLPIEDCLDALLADEIDLLFGVSKSTDRLDYLSFSNLPIASEPMSLYTNKNLEDGNLHSLNNLKLGFINKESNHEWILDLLNEKNINVELIEAKSYNELENLLINYKVDAIPHLTVSDSLKSFKKIFDFSIGKIYLATSKSNQTLMDKINSLLLKSNPDNIVADSAMLYNDYFYNGGSTENSTYQFYIIIIMFLIVCLLLFLILYRPFKKIFIRRSIQNHLDNNDFILHFQPIIDPKSKSIKAFEGLIRLNKNGKILSPFLFLDKIENSNMMHKISEWLIKEAIKSFDIIKEFDCAKNSNFYISINLSFKEIEDSAFVDSIIKLLKESNLQPYCICLEIVERFKTSDLDKIQSAIDKLKSNGFLVAIDDFGVEYSNLDILEKIDCNIVKLDKFFIDEIESSLFRSETINFISTICEYTNKVLICEGVETELQNNFVKNSNNNKFYIQGYYYSKPLPIYEIKNFIVK